MADLSITAGNVLKGTGASITSGTCGAVAITAGQAVYLDSTTATLLLSDHGASGTARCDGIALNSAGVGQPVQYLTAGNITIGATVSIGEPYYVSNTAGGICPDADLGTGDYVSFIGIGISTSQIRVARSNTGITHA